MQLDDQTSILIPSTAFESTDPAAIVAANVGVVNALRQGFVEVGEIAPAAMQSYLVDYFRGVLEEAGFARFVYLSRWNRSTVDLLRDGLGAIGATLHQVIFDNADEILGALSETQLKYFLTGELDRTDEIREFLNTSDASFCDIEEHENLLELNAAWLRQHPDLRVMPPEELDAEVQLLLASLPGDRGPGTPAG